MLVGQLRSLLLSEFSSRADPRWVAKACRISLLLISMMIAGAMLLTPWALPLLFGGAFRPAIVPALILLFATVPVALVGVLGAAMTAFGRPLAVTMAQVAGLIATVIGLPLIVPAYGATGAAVVSVVSYYLVLGVLLRLTCRELHLRLTDLLWPSVPEAIAVIKGRRSRHVATPAAAPRADHVVAHR
jgi:O-antigen/teichoic acid export membrane protein